MKEIFKNNIKWEAYHKKQLQNKEYVALYINIMLEKYPKDRDFPLFLNMLRDIIIAREFDERVDRDGIHTALHPYSNPDFDTLVRALKALGLRFVVEEIV